MSDFAKGGHITGPDGEDTIKVTIGRGEKFLTAEQIRALGCEETRGGDENTEWKISYEALRQATDQAAESMRRYNDAYKGDSE